MFLSLLLWKRVSSGFILSSLVRQEKFIKFSYDGESSVFVRVASMQQPELARSA